MQGKNRTPRYTIKDCDGINPSDVIDRETMRLKRLKIEQGKAEFFTKIWNSMRSFTKRTNDFLSTSKEVLGSMDKTSMDELMSVTSEISVLIGRVEKLREKALSDADLFSEPVADIACAGNRARQRRS